MSNRITYNLIVVAVQSNAHVLPVRDRVASNNSLIAPNGDLI